MLTYNSGLRIDLQPMEQYNHFAACSTLKAPAATFPRRRPHKQAGELVAQLVCECNLCFYCHGHGNVNKAFD